jgi:hypothetical protein
MHTAKNIFQIENFCAILLTAVNSKFFKGGNMAAKKKAAKKAARCPAKTKAGKQCKNKASGKSKFCASHKK